MTDTDVVNHPKHYTSHPVFSGECIKYTRHMTFAQGNAFKYLWRCTMKGKYVEDLKKAMWYLYEIFALGAKTVEIPAPLINNLCKDFANYIRNENYDPEVALRASTMISLARGI